LKGVNLREKWNAFASVHGQVTSAVKPEFVIKVIAVLQGKEPRKGNLLDAIDALDARSFDRCWEEATSALVAAYNRVTTLYGAFQQEWIPYTTMLVPLAALLCELNTIKAGAAEYEKIDRWYWANVFTQRYDSAVDTKTFQDLRDVRRWITDSVAPSWIQRASLQDLDLDVDEPRSAIYRGLMCLIVCRGAKDFLTGQPANLHQCQDDHIFPRGIYSKNYPVDTILNRTLISERTNKVKQNRRPSIFLDECLRGHGYDETKLLKTLDSHFISPAAYHALRADDFSSFIRERRMAFSRAIEERLT
ncbi:MAG: hypothetical protein IRY83_15180, partial [Chloroflexi bacterium]|nr:hypothetical protein [Chloroflexota bacterium]